MLPYPSKRFGQHFLIDNNIVKKIINSGNYQKNDLILEIGPGRGALTKELIKIVPKLYAVEFDKKMVSYLNYKYSQLVLFCEDALKFNYNKPRLLFAQENNTLAKIKIIGNLPYNIATELIFRFIDNIDKLEEIIIMLQKEVASRLLAPISTKDYGRLTVSSKYFFNIEKVHDVNANAFYPPPKVNSTVIRLIPKSPNQIIKCDRNQLFEMIKTSFSKRRKKISNNLKSFFSTELLNKIGNKHNINNLASLRAQDIPLQVYIEMVNTLYDK